MQVQQVSIQISSLWLATIKNGPASKLFRVLIYDYDLSKEVLYLRWDKCHSRAYFDTLMTSL